MELNKYDLVELLAYKLKAIPCCDCPISEECDNREKLDYICFDEDETKKLLLRKYNL